MVKGTLIFINSGKSQLSKFRQANTFVEILDKCFENVCELNLIFHVDKAHNILAAVVVEGMVLETNTNEIVTHTDAQNKPEKSEAGLTIVTPINLKKIKNMNLPEIPRDFNIGNISIKGPNLPSLK
ncbi:AP-3 complex subunit sigma-1-like [Rhinolophus ferrumequinum]|uniref:AP-3 complex subunit sigma-1-like n=1 Tax=Rhinolophus ferrumequinum TaxID=59479 RepID=UPI00140F9A58|nr:AP-3 complex subunit sigma-1-like [Rhinolophus ferrumequinum]